MVFFIVMSSIMLFITISTGIYMLTQWALVANLLRMSGGPQWITYSLDSAFAMALSFLLILVIYFISAIIFGAQSNNLRNYVLNRLPKKAEDFRR